MPRDRRTPNERFYYAQGFNDGLNAARDIADREEGRTVGDISRRRKPKRKLSAWNKYVKANSKKPRFRYRNGKLNLKKMAIAFRKTTQPARKES